MQVGAAEWVASAVAFAIAMAASPGPNNAMLAASGATFGFRRTVPHWLGVSIGFPAMFVAVALGAGELLRARPWLHDALRWVGAAYLLWLAWHIAASRPSDPGADAARRAGRPLGFLGAALFQWVNPKAWVIAVGAIVTYTTATGAQLLIQAALLAAILLSVTLPATAAWTLMGVGAARVLRSPRAIRAFNIALAALLVASLVPLFTD